MLSVVETPVSSAASCLRLMVGAVGAVWSSRKALVAVDDLLPAASVETTDRPTLPSGRPPVGSVPLVGVAVLVSMDQLPVPSVVAVYVTAAAPLGVTTTVTVLLASAVPTSTGWTLDVMLSVAEAPVSSAA